MNGNWLSVSPNSAPLGLALLATISSPVLLVHVEVRHGDGGKEFVLPSASPGREPATSNALPRAPFTHQIRHHCFRHWLLATIRVVSSRCRCATGPARPRTERVENPLDQARYERRCALLAHVRDGQACGVQSFHEVDNETLL